jgi:hypothetical protein
MRHRSLSIPDARGQEVHLRVTRHPEQRKVVLSHWRDGLCVSSTPVEVGEVPALIGQGPPGAAEGRVSASQLSGRTPASAVPGGPCASRRAMTPAQSVAR